MTVETTTTWTCDRCGAKEHLPANQGTDSRPGDWAYVFESTPPRSSTEKATNLGVICNHCRSDLREWLAEGAPRP